MEIHDCTLGDIYRWIFGGPPAQENDRGFY